MNGYPIWLCLCLLLAAIAGTVGGISLAFSLADRGKRQRKGKPAEKDTPRSLRSRMHRQDNGSFSAFRNYEQNRDHLKTVHSAREAQDDSYAYIAKEGRSS